MDDGRRVGHCHTKNEQKEWSTRRRKRFKASKPQRLKGDDSFKRTLGLVGSPCFVEAHIFFVVYLFVKYEILFLFWEKMKNKMK
jgi:hypothetical protein